MYNLRMGYEFREGGESCLLETLQNDKFKLEVAAMRHFFISQPLAGKYYDLQILALSAILDKDDYGKDAPGSLFREYLSLYCFPYFVDETFDFQTALLGEKPTFGPVNKKGGFGYAYEEMLRWARVLREGYVNALCDKMILQVMGGKILDNRTAERSQMMAQILNLRDFAVAFMRVFSASLRTP